MDLKEYCYSLTKDRLSELAIRLCDRAYPIWENYCETGNLSYRDTTVGELHFVDKSLLADALNSSHRLQSNFNSFTPHEDILLEKLSEPITALQDDDWILPYPVERVFYAVQNLFKGFKHQKNEFGELAHYLSVNQAVDAIYKAEIMPVDELKKFIYSSVSK